MPFLSRYSSKRPRRALCCYDHLKSKCLIRGRGHLLWVSKSPRNLLGTLCASLQHWLNWFKQQVRASWPEGFNYRGLKPQLMSSPREKVPLERSTWCVTKHCPWLFDSLVTYTSVQGHLLSFLLKNKCKPSKLSDFSKRLNFHWF